MPVGILRILSGLLVVSFIAVLLVAPYSSTTALSSKTYSFTPTHAKNYVTTGSIDFMGISAASDWYDPAWGFRQKITIKKDFVGEELTDFPVVIRLNESIADQMRDDRFDLLFTSSDGLTKLAHEREDETTIWVKVPKLTPEEDTLLYLYYGNPTSEEDQARPNDVWTNGYVGVWHLNDNPEAAIPDSTKNANTGTSSGGMNEGNLREGIVGKALEYDGANDYVEIGDVSFLDDLTSFTFSLWMKTDSIVGFHGLVGKWTTPPANGPIMFIGDDQVYWQVGVHTIRLVTSTGVIRPNTWHHLVGINRNGVLELYVNGNKRIETGTAGTNTNHTNTLKIGLNNEGGTGYTDGLIDNFHISTGVRSSTWIATEYRNQCDCEDFLTVSPDVETNATPGVADTTPGVETAATVQLKADRPLLFSALTSFTANAGGTTPTFQLSNDGGKTWLFYTKDGWKGANPNNPEHRSSAHDISGHLSTFPTGEGKLLWKAYLPSGTSLDQITVTYSPRLRQGSGGQAAVSAVTSLADPRMQAINELHRTAFGRDPTLPEWLTWATRLVNGDKTTHEELLGAMEYSAAQ